MNMKKSLPIFLWLLLAHQFVAYTQTSDSLLTQQLSGKNNLSDIMNTVKAYYKNPETTNRLGTDAVSRSIKHWTRYEWYMSSRLGPNGEFVNINQKMMEATGIQQRGIGNTGNLVESSTATWSPVGPLNTTDGIGRVDRLAFHPADADIVYAGTTAGGLWRTTDAGANWTNLSSDIPSGGISGIAINPDNTNTIYILTGDGDSNGGGLVDNYGYMRLSIGVLKSTNGGANWTKMGPFPGADYSSLVGYRLTMHPTNPDTLFACTNQGIFRTGDGGTNWTLVEDEGRFYNLKFRPGSSTICYAVSLDGGTAKFFKSTNSGNSFTDDPAIAAQINNPTSRIDLAVAPTNTPVVYILAGGVQSGGGFFKGVYRSGDSGDSFVQQANTPNILGRASDGSDNVSQSWYDLTIAVSNLSSFVVAVGAVQVWRSLNSGVDWVYRGALHDDVHELGFHPVDNKLWAACDGGVFSSIDNGATWTSHFEDMNISQFYRMAVNPDDYTAMIAGAQDNAVKRRSGATSYFDEIACCDGFAVGYDNFNPDTIFAVTNRSISRSVNGGNNFSNISPANSANPFSMAMAVHTSLTDALFIGSDSLWRSTNGGSTWTVTPGFASGWFIRTCPSNGNRVFAAGGTSYSAASGNLWRSDNAGVSWGPFSLNGAGSGFPFNFPKITCINVDPNNSNNVWVTFGGFTDGVKVYYSNNAGDNWFDRSGTLPNVPVNCIALDINNNAYIGTDNGVYYRGTGTSDWVPFYNNLPYVPVTELIISEADNRIRASTFGRGIWSSDLYSTCVANLNITGTLEGQEFHEASNNIVSTASLLTSEGTKVQMRGGNEVLLEAGFTARETTNFRAAIGPCGSGGVAGFRMVATDSSAKLPVRQYLSPPGGKRSMIHIHSATGGEIHFEVNQKQSGETDIILTDESGNIIRNKNFASSQTGKWVNTISSTGLTAGIYYLNVLLDKRAEHIQEVIIR
jgi:photosystem II stability/assembly factor-like uncharacterized protein